MGSPKKQRKKFSKPSHPWQKDRILAEKDLLISYGLNRKYEIWKMNTLLKNFTTQAKNLVTTKTLQSDKEKSQLLKKLSSLGLIKPDAKIEDVLSLTLKDVMDRRLQTIVYKKSIARSLKQARQFIVHQHISVNDRKITAPSYIVPLNEEGRIQFSQGSAFIDPNHPEVKIEEDRKKKDAVELAKEPKKESAKERKPTKSKTETKQKEAKTKKQTGESKSQVEQKAPKEQKPAEAKQPKTKEQKPEETKSKEEAPKDSKE
jgi:small subunit ribosomal protein S4